MSAFLDPALLGADPAGPVAPPPAPPATGGAVLEAWLAERPGRLHFSNHARQRVQRRAIALDAAALDRLHRAVVRLAAKGAREAVAFVDGTAFVVSVRNATVITAVGPAQMREHIFTNIDSAVIA